MGLARRLEHIGSGLRHPVMLHVVPASAQDMAVHGRRMAMPAQDAGAAHAQQVDPVALAGVQAERTEPDILRLWNPETLVLRDDARDDDLALGFLGEGQLVRHPARIDIRRRGISDDVRHRWTFLSWGMSCLR